MSLLGKGHTMEQAIGYDLTMPLDGVIRVRDRGPTLVLRSQVTLDGLQRISELQLFPHSLTHMDLLFRINWRQNELLDLLPDHVRATAESAVSLPAPANQVMKCTIVSLKAKAAIMRDACERTWASKRPRHPSEHWPPDVFRFLLQELRVTAEDLAATSISKSSFIIFYTGWREFAPNDGDLTYVGWYPWHPYIMNPYLVSRPEDTCHKSHRQCRLPEPI